MESCPEAAAPAPPSRYADLHNQHALFGTLPPHACDADAMARLNERVLALSAYHAHTAAMELAYACRDLPTPFRGRVEVSEQGTTLCTL